VNVTTECMCVWKWDGNVFYGDRVGTFVVYGMGGLEKCWWWWVQMLLIVVPILLFVICSNTFCQACAPPSGHYQIIVVGYGDTCEQVAQSHNLRWMCNLSIVTLVEVAWYIKNIVTYCHLSITSVLYRRFRYQFSDIAISYRWQVKYRWFINILSCFSRLFSVNLKTNNYMRKLSISFANVTSLHLY